MTVYRGRETGDPAGSRRGLYLTDRVELPSGQDASGFVPDPVGRAGGSGLLPEMRPVAVARGWASFVNRAETEEELEALRRSVAQGSPYREADWQKRTAVGLKPASSLRDPWRPKKAKKPEE